MEAKLCDLFQTCSRIWSIRICIHILPTDHQSRNIVLRLEAANFVGMEGDTRMIRAFVPLSNRVRWVCQADFHFTTHSPLPSETALLDGLARQRVIEEAENVNHENLDTHLQDASPSL